MKRLLAIGDIHGFYYKFVALYYKLRVNPEEDMVIFLGDYTDRGHNSNKMMEWVMDHFDEPHITFLKGNHELMCYNACRGEDDLDLWLLNGGKETVTSLKGDKDMMRRWLKTIEKMPEYKEVVVGEKDFVFCHAGINPREPLENQKTKSLLWDRSFVSSKYRGKYTVVVGHTPVQFTNALGSRDEIRPVVANDGHLIMLDTGVYLSNGRLSCMDVLSDRAWMA